MLGRGDGHVLRRFAGPSLGVVVLLACAGGDAPAGETGDSSGGTPGGGGAEDSVPETTIVDTAAGLRVALSTDRASYAAGAPVRMALAVTNASDDTVTFRFSSSQRYEFVVREVEDDAGDGAVRWRWSEGRMFAQVTGEEAVPPGGSLRYEATLEEGLVEPGLYTVEGFVAAANRPTGARVTVRVHD